MLKCAEVRSGNTELTADIPGNCQWAGSEGIAASAGLCGCRRIEGVQDKGGQSAGEVGTTVCGLMPT